MKSTRVLTILCALFFTSHAIEAAPFIRGDTNEDGEHDISDAIKILIDLFTQQVIECRDGADFNDSGAVDISDAVYGLNFLFTRGSQPPSPFPSCGEDLTGDNLDCVSHAVCPVGPAGEDTLSTALGCDGVFNPDQIVDYHFSMSAGDWNTVQSDSTFSVYVPAQFRCGGGNSIAVGIRHKRSGGSVKVGMKVDVNRYVAGQSFADLKKLSLENGVSQGGTTAGSALDLVTEYLAWRLMVLSGAFTGRVSFVRVHVNEELIGVYVNVEQVDKRFLRSRFEDDSGWLFKKSGGVRDGFKTNEMIPDPFADYFCFWDNNPCAVPSAEELATTLPERLNIDQMLRVGGVNALMGNADSPLLKDNNYYFYDWSGGRTYLPWDLDTVMNRQFDVFTGPVPGGTTQYTDVLFTHWRGRYGEILTQLLAGPISLEIILAEIDRALEVAGQAIDEDPNVEGSAADAVADLKAWWLERFPQVEAQLATN